MGVRGKAFLRKRGYNQQKKRGAVLYMRGGGGNAEEFLVTCCEFYSGMEKF